MLDSKVILKDLQTYGTSSVFSGKKSNISECDPEKCRGLILFHNSASYLNYRGILTENNILHAENKGSDFS